MASFLPGRTYDFSVTVPLDGGERNWPSGGDATFQMLRNAVRDNTATGNLTIGQTSNTGRYHVTMPIPADYATHDVVELYAFDTEDGIEHGAIVFQTVLGPETISSSGSGAYSVDITVTDTDDVPIEGANVRITSGIFSPVVSTDSSGLASFSSDAATLRLTVSKPGYHYTPSDLVVSDNTVATVQMDALVVAPASPPQTNAFITCYDTNANVLPGITLTYRFVDTLESSPGESYPRTSQTTDASDSSGLITVLLRQSSKYQFRRDTGPWVDIETDDQATFELNLILGKLN